MIGVVLVAIAHSVLWPALGSLVAGNVSNQKRGAAIGFMTAIYDIGTGLASILFGVMATRVGTSDVFLVASGFVIFAALFDAFFAPRSQRKNSNDSLAEVGETTIL